MISRNIYQMGIELEGSFADDHVRGGGSFKGDCSIEGLEGYYGDEEHDYCNECDSYTCGCYWNDSNITVIGEKVSNPMNSLPDVFRWIRLNWVEDYNATCGMHVHVSFGEVNPNSFDKHLGIYSACVQGQPQRHVLEELAKEFKLDKMREPFNKRMIYSVSADSPPGVYELAERMSGNNRYCGYTPNYGDVLRDGGERYAIVNADAWFTHKTLEIRVLPMMQQSYIKRAINAVVLGLEKAIWAGRKRINSTRRIQTFTIETNFQLPNIKISPRILPSLNSRSIWFDLQ